MFGLLKRDAFHNPVNTFFRLGSCCPFHSSLYPLEPCVSPSLLPECALFCCLVHAVGWAHASFLLLPWKMLLILQRSPQTNPPHEIYQDIFLSPYPGTMNHHVLPAAPTEVYSWSVVKSIMSFSSVCLLACVSSYLLVALKCDPGTSSTSFTWKLVRKSGCQTLFQIHCIRNSLNNILRWTHININVWEWCPRGQRTWLSEPVS